METLTGLSTLKVRLLDSQSSEVEAIQPMSTSTALVARPSDLSLAGPLGSLDAYLDRVSRIPVLTREEEQRLARRFREENDLEAARELVLSHLRFVVHIARGYAGYGLPLGDLIQEGNVGLMKAVKRFDPSLNVRLVSFAVHWIRAEIHEYVLRNWRLVKIATTKAQRKLFFNLRRLKKNLAWLTSDETQAVARDLGVSTAEVTEMEQRLAARDLSFDPVPESDEDEAYGPSSYLPAPEADPATQVESDEWDADTASRLEAAIERLDARSREIVQRRFLTDDKATLHELAGKYGVSAERIRQIEANALGKLKGFMEPEQVHS
jgi:RNA polymerase sigma-32 factor